MAALARLHAALAAFPFPARSQPLARLHERLQRLEGRRRLAGSRRMALDLDSFHAGAGDILAAAESLPWEAASFQYCHGDFQLENVLFAGGEVSGIVDFDSLMFSARELDLAFALFSICRARDDRAFRWDAALLDSCLGHYLDAARDWGCPPSPDFFEGANLDLLRKLFCLDQALQHLDCAARGIWELAGGIGFLSCYREVLPPGGG
jgi:aminoglycoside phosphotransferase